VIDVFIAAVRFMAGERAEQWWKYTPERKRAMAANATSRLVALTCPARTTRVRFALQLNPAYHEKMEKASLSLLARLRRSPEAENWNRLVDYRKPGEGAAWI
jgi:hypothetical protein